MLVRIGVSQRPVLEATYGKECMMGTWQNQYLGTSSRDTSLGCVSVPTPALDPPLLWPLPLLQTSGFTHGLPPRRESQFFRDTKVSCL